MILRLKNIQSLALVAYLLAISACSVNPVTGKKELTLMSATQEVAMGAKNYGPYQQQQGGRYIVDPDLTVYVSQVGRKLAAASGRPQLPYEFVVLNNSTPNAWALPGGKIAINRGLLTLLDDESQLAAVLSHEVVHAAARHSARQMTQAKLMSAGLVVAGIAAQQTDYGQWIAAGAGVGAKAWQSKYGRGQELESDAYGITYMINAGYEPLGAVELQEKFLALSQGRKSGFMENLFSSHPPSAHRVERNKHLASGKTPGARNKAQFEKAMSQLKQDAPAYELHAQALKEASNKNVQPALSFINQAIKKQPKEALFYITLGQLLLSESSANNPAALKAFKRARSLNPEYYMGHLGTALTLIKEKSSKAEAVAAFGKSMKLLPTPVASYYLGEAALRKGDLNGALSYFKFAAQGQGKTAELAQAQLLKLSPPTAKPSAS